MGAVRRQPDGLHHAGMPGGISAGGSRGSHPSGACGGGAGTRRTEKVGARAQKGVVRQNMPNERDLNLKKYSIGKYEYRELRNFCLQYPEKKKRLVELRSPYQSPQINDMPHGSFVGDQTGRSAERAAALSDYCDLIEKTAKEAGADIYQSLLVNVTNEHMPWEILAPPCGRRQFYDARRKFFYLLYLKKGHTKDVLP